TGAPVATQTRDSASAANPRSDASRNTVAIGAGIGAPLAILALTAIGIVLFKERNRRKFAEQRLNDASKLKNALDETQGLGTAQREGHQRNEGYGPQELNGRPPEPQELQSNQLYEVISPL
ncbi:MAG: hypothetical protein Q9174_005761, partial [Haloplaca sp. 1 TL-2023]